MELQKVKVSVKINGGQELKIDKQLGERKVKRKNIKKPQCLDSYFVFVPSEKSLKFH